CERATAWITSARRWNGNPATRRRRQAHNLCPVGRRPPKQMLKHSRRRDDICSKNVLAFLRRKTYNPGLRTKLKVNQALPHDRAHR
ncbi:hypothetical protein, partial [Pseudomonas aeruginosa]|uniref:hypothetical protein n=1 Tax=Pseudomonas aeruginosa TaxID=287 RepID=UPI001955B663